MSSAAREGVRDRGSEEPSEVRVKPYTEAEIQIRREAVAEMERLRHEALASGLRTWSGDEVNEYVRRIRSGEPTDDLLS